jgi:glycosyltransferase involved in cell wall biosynthesis
MTKGIFHGLSRWRRRRKELKVVALVAMRNEMLYIERCISHLIDQGIDIYVMDNDSTDGSAELARSFLGKGVLGVERFPYEGLFNLKGQLERKGQLAREIDADWFIHQDADEIREAPLPHRTLREGIAAADALGYNAVNFDEFVFVPAVGDGSFEGRDYVREMKYYYYFSKKKKVRRLNAWKKTKSRVDLCNRGGHVVQFRGRKILPVNYILRHYIALSGDHAVRKYCDRKWEPAALKRGWHKVRSGLTPERIVLPPRDLLKECRNDGVWDRTDPQARHLLFA